MPGFRRPLIGFPFTLIHPSCHRDSPDVCGNSSGAISRIWTELDVHQPEMRGIASQVDRHHRYRRHERAEQRTPYISDGLFRSVCRMCALPKEPLLIKIVQLAARKGW
jgi:hypothetical protein